jgi:hypothetical protein
VGCSSAAKTRDDMKRIVRYIAIDPYYSDVTQTYIGTNSDEIDAIQSETERFMCKEHSNTGNIYRSEVIKDETDEIINYER